MNVVPNTHGCGNEVSYRSETTKQKTQDAGDRVSEMGKKIYSSENSSVPTRLSSLYKIPTTFVNNTISAAIYIFAIIQLLARLASSELEEGEAEGEAEEEAENFSGTYKIIAEPFLHFVKFINPSAQIEIEEIPMYCFTKWSISTMINNRESENFFKKHVVSRLVLSMLVVTATVVSIAQGSFGAIAGALSVVSLGKSERLNQWATWGLQVNLIADWALLGATMYNPSIFSNEDIS